MTCWPPADARRPAMGKATRPPRSHLAAQLGLVFGLWRCAGGAAGLHRARQPLLNAEVPEHFSLLRCGAAGRPAEARQLVWKRPVSNFAHRSWGCRPETGVGRRLMAVSWHMFLTCFGCPSRSVALRGRRIAAELSLLRVPSLPGEPRLRDDRLSWSGFISHASVFVFESPANDPGCCHPVRGSANTA